MPILRINKRLVYYCHVPKAAGTALEAYLAAQFGPLAFTDGAFYTVEEPDRWTRSSPQHVDIRSLGRLFPEGFFDEVFAVVRNPFARIVSAFKFQKFVENRLPADTRFDDWVKGLRKTEIEKRWVFDNHLLPMHLLVPNNARVFRLEDGLKPVTDYLRELARPQIGLSDTVEPLNVTSSRLRWMGIEDEDVEIDADSRSHIGALYREDFERFGYSVAEDASEPPGEAGRDRDA